MKKLLSIFIIGLLTLFAVGCGEDNGGDSDKLRVALILSGPANDQGWNAIALEGLVDAEEEYGIETAYMENVELADSEGAFNDYASQGYDLIIGHGFQYGDPAKKVSASFPDQYFMATEANSESENMASYVMSGEQGAYLMGILAASMSTSDKLGAVGGFEQPSIVKEVEAFKLGAKSVKPDITIYEIYIGTYTDVNVGKEAALSMIDNGADVIYHVANQAGTGVIKAAEENGILVCGNSYDQNSIAPDTVICSTVYSMPKVILTAVENVREGTFEGGVYHLGIKEGAVDISSYNGFEDKIPEDVKEHVQTVKDEIVAGTFEVPVIETPTK